MTEFSTTKQVADKIGRHPGHIRNVANWHNIGTLITPRMRVFTTEDVEKIRALCSVPPGRKKRVPQE